MPNSEDTPKKTETPAPEPKPEKKPEPAPKQESENDAKLKRLEAELAELQKNQTTKDKELEQFRQAEQKRKEAELSAQELADKRQAEIEQLKRENILVRKAAEKGLDPKLFDRVKGSTEDEIDKDIDTLLELFSKAKQEDDKDADPETKDGAGKKTQPGKQTKPADTKRPVNKHVESIMSWRQANLKG